MTGNITLLIIVGVVMFAVLGGVTLIAHIYSLNGIKSRTVGDGQHGTARWANRSEIRKTYKHVPFTPEQWREQAKESKPPVTPDGQPLPQGIVVGCTGNTTAMVDTGDVHALMIGAAGVGKTAYWLYPCIEYACASGMSFLSTDTKGDIMRNYGQIAKDYGYHISVIDLRNPTRSNGNNLLHLVNKYMDLYQAHPDQLVYKARCEKYAKIISKTIILSGMDAASFGQNAYFYDAAEGLLTATILLVAEFCEPKKRHIVSVFQLIQDLLVPDPHHKGKNGFQLLMNMLPERHQAKRLATSAVGASEQSMASVISTALSRLNVFLDTEMEQVLCFDSPIDAETFASQKSAIFLIVPEEDTTKHFMASLTIQNLARELFSLADENHGKLKKRVVFFCDELGTMPPFDILPLFSAGRSRRLTMVPIIQSIAQLEKNEGKEGAEIIQDNVQDTIFGGFAPNSQTAEVLSKALGNRTVMSGSVNRGKNDTGQSLQMISRPLMTPDELKSIPKGEFVVMKTGTHPMRTRLRLFLEWGITFGEPYQVPERSDRRVDCAGKKHLVRAILCQRQSGEPSAHVDGQSGYNTTRRGVIL